MNKYKVYATATINYEVEVEGNSEIEALSTLDDWIQDDFEDYKVHGSWDFTVEEIEDPYTEYYSKVEQYYADTTREEQDNE
jgi:hypothetical protein